MSTPGRSLSPYGRRVVEENMPLALKVMVESGQGKRLDYADRRQVAMRGLIQAVLFFDDSYGIQFSTYAWRVIVTELRRANVSDVGAVRIPFGALCQRRPETRDRAMNILHAAVFRLDADWDEPAYCEDGRDGYSDAAGRLWEAIERLCPRDRAVIEGRYLKGQTLRYLGSQFGVTRERIRQIEATAIRRLRARLVGPACPHLTTGGHPWTATSPA